MAGCWLPSGPAPKTPTSSGFSKLPGSFAGPPPAPGVGPGALADPRLFLQQLATAGIEAHVEIETLGFDVDSFAVAWDVLARVTTAHLAPNRTQA